MVQEQPTPPPRPARPAEARSDLPSPAPVLWAFLAARLVMVVGIASLLLASATLLLFGAVETYRHVALLVAPSGAPLTNREVFLASIKLIDLVLLATILQVVAIGLYSLFIARDIPVPEWLRTADVDDLKCKLAGIVAVMLGVLFLEQVIQSGGEGELLALGIAIAAVIAALSYFIKVHPDQG
ncbi:MAG TPA: YqhA family protein [Geminicoccaceae bacterium]|nr:YqhA family protein [Geminicoccaceae bacterium]